MATVSWRKGIGGPLDDHNGVSADSIVAEQIAAHQETLDEIFGKLQGGIDALLAGVASLSSLPEKEVKKDVQKRGDDMNENQQPEITLESIRPGMSQSEILDVVRQIRKALPSQSITNLTADAERFSEENLSPEIKRQRDAQRAREAASAPPSLDPASLTGKSDAEKNAIVTKYVQDRDVYFSNLMSRPTGQAFTRTEGSALAAEALAALREIGHRVV